MGVIPLHRATCRFVVGMRLGVWWSGNCGDADGPWIGKVGLVRAIVG